MKGYKNTGKKENNGIKRKKGNIILLVLLLLILLVVPCFALGASIGDDVKVHFNSSEQVSSETPSSDVSGTAESIAEVSSQEPVSSESVSQAPASSATESPTGTFKTTRKYRWHALVESTYGQYCTRLGNTSILFHSVPGKTTSIHNITAEEYNKLGAPASHGCIRMTVADCKWIYDHCPSGTVVTVGDNLPAPFDRPETEKIPEGQDWDPTDPEIG